MPEVFPAINLESIVEKIEALHKPFQTRLYTFGKQYDACTECSNYKNAEMFNVKVPYPCKTLKIVRGEL